MLSTWTIPTDPGYQTRRPNSAQRYEPVIDGSRPKPRVKPEALSNAIKGQGSLALLFNPTSKPYTLLSRPGMNFVLFVFRLMFELLLCSSNSLMF